MCLSIQQVPRTYLVSILLLVLCTQGGFNTGLETKERACVGRGNGCLSPAKTRLERETSLY